jgi:hypothetical protein
VEQQIRATVGAGSADLASEVQALVASLRFAVAAR